MAKVVQKSMAKKKLTFTRSILWSDEAKFNLYKSDGPQRVWKLRGDRINPKCIASTKKCEVDKKVLGAKNYSSRPLAKSITRSKPHRAYLGLHEKETARLGVCFII
eukprot:Platyproteum_vivax@DN14453_c0_g1_i1.p1